MNRCHQPQNCLNPLSNCDGCFTMSNFSARRLRAHRFDNFVDESILNGPKKRYNTCFVSDGRSKTLIRGQESPTQQQKASNSRTGDPPPTRADPQPTKSIHSDSFQFFVPSVCLIAFAVSSSLPPLSLMRASRAPSCAMTAMRA